MDPTSLQGIKEKLGKVIGNKMEYKKQQLEVFETLLSLLYALELLDYPKNEKTRKLYAACYTVCVKLCLKNLYKYGTTQNLEKYKLIDFLSKESNDKCILGKDDRFKLIVHNVQPQSTNEVITPIKEFFKYLSKCNHKVVSICPIIIHFFELDKLANKYIHRLAHANMLLIVGNEIFRLEPNVIDKSIDLYSVNDALERYFNGTPFTFNGTPFTFKGYYPFEMYACPKHGGLCNPISCMLIFNPEINYFDIKNTTFEFCKMLYNEVTDRTFNEGVSFNFKVLQILNLFSVILENEQLINCFNELIIYYENGQTKVYRGSRQTIKYTDIFSGNNIVLIEFSYNADTMDENSTLLDINPVKQELFFETLSRYKDKYNSSYGLLKNDDFVFDYTYLMKNNISFINSKTRDPLIKYPGGDIDQIIENQTNGEQYIKDDLIKINELGFVTFDFGNTEANYLVGFLYDYKIVNEVVKSLKKNGLDYLVTSSDLEILKIKGLKVSENRDDGLDINLNTTIVQFEKLNDYFEPICPEQLIDLIYPECYIFLISTTKSTLKDLFDVLISSLNKKSIHSFGKMVNSEINYLKKIIRS